MEVDEHHVGPGDDALSMSFRSMDLSFSSNDGGMGMRRGSIEVRHEFEDNTRLKQKRAQKMRQMQGGCDGCVDGINGGCVTF